MKDYPSIPGSKELPIGQPCIAFYKYDGSNLRVEYAKKRGWYKWGTRRRMLDKSDPEFGIAIDIFEKKYAEPLAKAIVDNKDFRGSDGAVAFMEFVGPHSFAGLHSIDHLKGIGIEITENPMDLMLFDININKKGFVGPRAFVKAFGHLDIAKVLYDGILTEEFVEEVRSGKYPVREGVVCKGGDGFKHNLWMGKIKTRTYIQELKDKFGVGWEKFAE